MSPLHVVILAAGQGSRMKSALPKVLHPIAGRPMLHHVIETAKQLGAEKIHTVIGHGADKVREATTEASVNWVTQSEQLGTGHAVAQALPDLPDDARVLVLYGDVPLTRHETLEGLVGTLDDNTLGLLTVTMDKPQGYGRIVRDANGDVQSIVEQKDASAEQQQIREVNTGILAVSAKHLKSWLPTLSNSNAQGEYYLTDIIAMAVDQGLRVSVSQPENPFEVQGVNNRLQLAELERWFQRRQADRLMTEGATLADPARVDVRGELSIGNDLWIDVNVVFEGKVSLGSNVSIGPGCVIKDATIADGAEIKAHSVIEGAVIGASAQIGPFARIRPGTELAANTKVGNFVETKKAIVGEGSKINHLSYVGDASLGRNVNVGAGTITCNYDGVNKYRTVLGDGVFVGSNTALVAPVTVAADATIGAGSTITRDVADHELAVARGRQRNIAGWEKPKKH
ncbi:MULTISPECIES: bifunctional UDP-N-acetylglucosamine diphosphorylase/glucosamine-1-phosphate N-acetyltransferase GlmU [Marinobacter]|jgi:bifunctional UDP-N-acetylglucosamine pyrophosphorylase/glucosamine-1-phosphate N-acetyltransferase|uniref:bifunctional UDP-N-acetylglucosamine diphosphorylase/glucosamine-1-phosphate N-acetyltransferase GlmU n=1 Tax=Marinobacter TaxID=2742 RepID=UPI0007DA1429|nr:MULTISPECIES: bifunctional UDP-N-acetylglucosamine diphosphorylase/glucosamine-1-phosphate N-acetyltransferase GlmU [unclassified Marinobacter]MBL3823541.1 bifunctional UDP-N-acetylglucosamine diphosphorylase/glucosamine-1-phosphate N-acetyltransferase GlmU [Marinobacter sp. MC3]MBL3891697.1 bifunctional UDP-N-acetylglucosamine diphosphorylase/glucosamine-1-phosphate N-acetyltransferase GlmU [Marinobacter sp. MW3]OAN88448.1 UDP-N-acetylglucosamine diphosphorylase/glucosamine-1-phosphate N-ace